MLQVGANYSRGQGVPKDEVRALQCYQRTAELGSAVAMDNVGTYYAMGRGVPVDKRPIAQYRRGLLRLRTGYEQYGGALQRQGPGEA